MLERILYKQIKSFLKNKFSHYLYGFRENHNAQYLFLKIIENWKKQLDNGEKVGVIFMDLSKAFDTISHSLLLAKLKAHGFSNQALSLLQRYLCNRFQRSIINVSFSNWDEVITGAYAGSILGPLLFNIFFCLSRNVNYVTIPKTTLYKSGKNMRKIKDDLEIDFMILNKWFHENQKVQNPGKCHYIVIGDDDPSHKIILNNNKIASSNEEKLLGILLDSRLNFDTHITSLCRLSALPRIN